MDFSVKDFNVRLRTIKIWELAIAIAIALVLITVITDFSPLVDESDDLFFIVFLSIVLAFFIWALRSTTGLKNNFSKLFEVKTRNEILYVFALNILFAFIITCIFSGLDLLYGLSDPSWVSGIDIDAVDTSAGSILLSSIASIIFAPMMEELIFRGVLFNRMKIRIGIIPAMLISSFIFAIGHNFGGIISAFLFGICMCILYLKTDNILVPMSVHFINNVVATVLELISIDSVISQMPWFILATVIVLIATVLLIKYIVKEIGLIKKSYS